MKTVLLATLIASSLMANGQIDDTLLSDLEMLAYEQESATGNRPEMLYYEAEGMGIETQIEEASNQVQQENAQSEVHMPHNGGGDYLYY